MVRAHECTGFDCDICKAAEPPKLRLAILAFHVSEIMTQPAPCEFTLSPCKGVDVNVKIKPQAPEQICNPRHATDRVSLNGVYVGFRNAARDAFVKMVDDAKPVIQHD